ncbi:MAG: succinyl-diaminopimelate desuccinylase [Actinobacteria bacterium]|nr:succinyl-diaminopimelate desuccinylase [Actinomycetota bacterium]
MTGDVPQFAVDGHRTDGGTDDQAAARLLTRATDLVSIPSISREEGQITDYIYNAIESRLQDTTTTLRPVELIRLDGNNIVYRTMGKRANRIVLASHVDTVPPAGGSTPHANVHSDKDLSRAHVDDGILRGLGAVDTKGSVAIMLDLLLSDPPPTVELTFIFYSREEVSRKENGLRQILETRPELLRGDVAIVGEPSGGYVEAGCQTTMTAIITLHGARAHTARPWTGSNAIHAIAPVIDRIARYQENLVDLDGCTFREQLQAVAINGGIASNVVPDVASVTANHRAAPRRTRQELERWLTEYVIQDTTGSLIVDDYAQGALPALSNPWIKRLVEITGRPPRAKLGWTDVATFAEAGIPACNFGPGDPELAHTPYEQVSATELASARSALMSLISDGTSSDKA